MKKIFITIIAMLLPLLASADANGTCGENLTWSYVEATKTLTISGTGAMTNYSYSNAPWYGFNSSIKNIIIESGVTSIGEHAFWWCNGLTSITIPNSVTNIGDYAFRGCRGLTSITIPNSVTSIGNNAFSCCSSLTSVTIPNSVTSIGQEAFRDCSSLTSITIPNSVTSIGMYAFSGCSGLTSIIVNNGNTKYDSRNNCNAIIEKSSNTLVAGCKNTIIPNSVTSIGGSAFVGCTGLTSITIPSSVTNIGGSAFHECSNLSSITIPNSVTEIGASAFYGTAWYNNQPDGLVYAGKVAYIYKGVMPANTNITIKDGTYGIAGWAFRDCNGLTSVTIPNSVTSIGSEAFSYCSGLTKVITEIENPFEINYNVFRGIPSYAELIVPEGTLDKYKAINVWKYMFANMCGATNCGICGVNVFYSYDETTHTLTIAGEGPMSGWDLVGEPDFRPWRSYLSGIYSIIIESGVTSIGWNAFSGCRNLTSVTIPNSVTWIEAGAFAYSGLSSITIPDGVRRIESDDWDGAFQGCTGLTSITIPNSVTIIDNKTFKNCSSLTSITIGNSVTSIGRNAFYGCNNLQFICLTSDKYPSTQSLGNTNCQYIMPQTAFDGGIPQDITNYATYGVTPMYVKVKSTTATSATLELTPIDIASGKTNETTTYEAKVYNLKPGAALKGSWEIEGKDRGVVSFSNVKTQNLVMTVQPAQALSTTKAKLSATVNEPNDDKHYGFEWRRIGVDDLVPSNVVYSQLYDGHIVGTLSGLNPDISYKYRPFYKSDSGDMFYGEWIGFLTGDANVFFEPEVHTNEPIALTEDGAQLSGVWVEGTEDTQEKGFEYWPKNSGARPTRAGNVTAVIVKGNNTSVTLEGLEAGTEYVYRSYLRTASGTVYGEEKTFKTPLMGDANDDGKVNVADIVEVVNAKAGKPSASFNMTNADVDGNGSITEAEIVKIILKK